MENLNDFLMTNTVPEELRALYDVIEETCKSWNTSLKELQRNLKLKDISLHSIGNLEDKISEVIDICCLKDELEKRYYENLNERYRVNILEYPYEENPYHYKTFNEYSTAMQELEDIYREHPDYYIEIEDLKNDEIIISTDELEQDIKNTKFKDLEDANYDISKIKQLSNHIFYGAYDEIIKNKTPLEAIKYVEDKINSTKTTYSAVKAKNRFPLIIEAIKEFLNKNN